MSTTAAFLDAALLDPLLHLDELFARTAAEDQSSSPNLDTFTQRASQGFASVFEEGYLRSIPVLDKHLVESGRLCPNTVVRFRGVVRDMMSPEFFIAAYIRREKTTGEQAWVQSIFKESIPMEDYQQISFDGSDVLHGERLPVVLVAVPGENEWVRRLDDDLSNTAPGCMIVDEVFTADRSDRKRPMDDDRENDDGDDRPGRNVSLKEDAEISARPTTTPFHPSALNKDVDLSCIAKFIDTADEQSLKLNDLIEVVAVYTLDNTQGPFNGGESEGDDLEGMMDDQLPPPSIMPRLQVLASRKLHSSFPYVSSMVDGRAVLPDRIDAVAVPDILSQLPFGRNIGAVRSSLLAAITEALSLPLSHNENAAVAAEYVLLALLSRIEARNDVGTVGCFSLNLVGSSSGDPRVRRLINLIETIVPRSINVCPSCYALICVIIFLMILVKYCR